jgi:phage terminase large subunit-like protein
VLADRTVAAASPLTWASVAVAAAEAFGARAIVAEGNQGGALVRAMLAGAGAQCELRIVHASQGKKARAEPIAALYERGLVTHCGAFPAFEEEMMAMGAAETSRLDRADALVWALTALMEDEGRSPLRIRRL